MKLNSKEKKVRQMNGGRMRSDSNTLLIIKLPDLRVLRILSRSLFVAIVVLTLPCIGSIIRGPLSSFNAIPKLDFRFDSIDVYSFNDILWDLIGECGVEKGSKGLIVSNGIGDVIDKSKLSKGNLIDLIIVSDLDSLRKIPDETFDFVVSFGIQNNEFIDRLIKIGGVLAIPFGNDISKAHSNYKIVSLKQNDLNTVAMRKIGHGDGWENGVKKQRTCGYGSEAKKVALEGLEDALLEPPRRALATNINYLPNLMEDSLESYPSRIFISVGSIEEVDESMEWFFDNYPTRNQNFETYVVTNAMKMGISEWLMKNVREDEYVVMKAEAEMVEEMLKGEAICLVDELFLECKNQWQSEVKRKSERAYWECLALYGRLRDEGIAVHQWWG